MTLPLDQQFPLEEELVYLNHAAVSPWPTIASEAVKKFAEQNCQRGATDYLQWLKVENRLRIQLRQLINAKSSDEIALLKNTSEAISIVAYGLEWQSGENIVSSNQEFPSNRIPWQSLADQGVEFRMADLADASSPEQALFDQCDQHTRLLTISSVQYASGLKLDLVKIGQFCQENNILFCVDAIQSLGVIPFDVQQIQADFVMADGHKWLLGPEGLALFYCRKPLIDTLKLNQYGWHMVEAIGDYDQSQWQPARSARRFECGSPNMLAIHALHSSLQLLLETGIDTVQQQLNQKINYLIDKIDQQPQLDLISAREQSRLAGIVTFQHKQIKTEKLYQALMEQQVICAARGGGIRFSPHFYTPFEKIDEAFQRLDKVINLITQE